MRPTDEEFDLCAFTRDGEPAAVSDLAHAMVVDLESMPAFQHTPETAPGRATLPLPDDRFAISMPLLVEGFGHVVLYADNCGLGYDPEEVGGTALNFPLEAAASRIAGVAGQREGLVGGPLLKLAL